MSDPSVPPQASEEAMNEAAREIATRIGGHDEDRCERIEDPRKACTCPPDESFRIAFEALDRVSRERTRQALERAASILDAKVKEHRDEQEPEYRCPMGWCEDFGCTTLESLAAAIRGLSDGESVASEEMEE